MKINHICYILLLNTSNAIAQDFQGVSRYKSHRKVDLKITNEEGNSEMKNKSKNNCENNFNKSTHLH